MQKARAKIQFAEYFNSEMKLKTVTSEIFNARSASDGLGVAKTIAMRFFGKFGSIAFYFMKQLIRFNRFFC